MNLKQVFIVIFLIFATIGTSYAVTPEIQHYYPDSDPTTTTGVATKFTVVINQSVTSVTWYINGTLKQTNTSGYVISYTNSTAGYQVNGYNVTVQIVGSDGNAANMTSRYWNWTVKPLYGPNIYRGPTTDISDLNTSARTFNVSSNDTVTVTWLINGTLVKTETGVTESTYTNSTAGYQRNPYNVTARVTNANGSNSTAWEWKRTIAPTATRNSPVESITDLNGNISRIFNISVDRIANISWTIDGIQKQYNENASAGITTYTNTTTKLTPGTYTVVAAINNTNGTGTNNISWTWIIPASTMTNLLVVTNQSTNGRIINGTNGTFNFSWTDTGNITQVNFTFPATFNISSIANATINSNLGNTLLVALTESTKMVNLQNFTGKNNTNIYVNFTAGLRATRYSSDNIVNLKTNKNSTGVNFTVYARNYNLPYFSHANNSVFTTGTETFSDNLTTTLPLIGQGHANLTFYAPNVTGQTNITAGYGATNASRVTVVFTNQTWNYTIFVETNPNVVNPVIVLSASHDLESGNLPLIIATATISSAIVVYAYLRKRRRH